MNNETLIAEAATTPEGSESQTAESTATGAEANSQTEQQAQTEAQAEAKPATPEGAPEKYEFVPPEGQKYDDVVIGKFGEVAKELNLTQTNASKLLEVMSPVIAQRQTEQVAEAVKVWADQTRNDAEIGGAKLDENLALGKKALDAFGTPQLRELLNKSGLGNHPEVIRFFVKTGKAISEDGFVSGSKTPPAATPAERMFPDMKK